MLINAFMTSSLDYCNALLGGCSAHLINKLNGLAPYRIIVLHVRYDLKTLAIW